MKIRLGLSFAAILLTVGIGAQEKKAKGVNYQGNVQGVNKNSSMIMVKTGDGTIRNVMFSTGTTFLYGHSAENKPGSVDQVKDGYYISCAGAMEKDHLMASRCVYRETR